MAFTSELKAGEITLTWEEPNNNGAEITMYTAYYGSLNNEQWGQTENITDVSVRNYVVKVEMGQKYKVLVTASNKYGESSKEGRIQRVDVPEGEFSASLPSKVLFIYLFIYLVSVQENTDRSIKNISFVYCIFIWHLDIK